MSFLYTNAVSALDDVPFKAKTILAALADYADDNGYCFPSMATIADKLGCSRRTVSRNLSVLEESKLISVERRKYNDGKGLNRSNAYTLLLDVVAHKVEEVVEEQIVEPVKKTLSDMPAVDMVKKRFKAKNVRKQAAKEQPLVLITAVSDFTLATINDYATAEEQDAVTEIIRNFCMYHTAEGTQRTVSAWYSSIKSQIRKRLPVLLAEGKTTRTPQTTTEKVTNNGWDMGSMDGNHYEQGFIDCPEDNNDLEVFTA